MLVYKISEYEGGNFIYRESDQGVFVEFKNFLDAQERGNSIYIEVVEISREEFNGHATADRIR